MTKYFGVMRKLNSGVRLLFSAIFFFLSSLPCFAGVQVEIESVPHLNSSGQQSYRTFLSADKHRAFAIAPGGSWGWKGGEVTSESAAEEALLACQNETEQSCVLYATDDNLVFDKKVWSTLWGPYLNQATVNQAPVGTARGARFYDLAFRDAKGIPSRLSTLRGKVVLLHFWGS